MAQEDDEIMRVIGEPPAQFVGIRCDNRPGAMGGGPSSRMNRPVGYDLSAIPQLTDREAKILASTMACSDREFQRAAAKQRRIARQIKQLGLGERT